MALSVVAGSLTEVAVIVAASVSHAAAAAGISTAAVKLTDSPSAMVPVLSIERLVGQVLPETERSKLSTAPVLLVSWTV